MTTVIVTRDANGILVWKPRTNVQLIHANFPATSDFWGKRWVSKTPVWISHGFFKLMFNEHQTQDYFPELNSQVAMNEKQEMRLEIR